jgi:hypothetical protein
MSVIGIAACSTGGVDRTPLAVAAGGYARGDVATGRNYPAGNSGASMKCEL